MNKWISINQIREGKLRLGVAIEQEKMNRIREGTRLAHSEVKVFTFRTLSLGSS